MESQGMPQVLVAAVDNDRMALLALRGILPQLLPGSRWLWGVGTADEAVRLALDPETRPRLLLVDMSLGDATGISVCRRIRQRDSRVALLGITAFSTADYAARAAEAGAQGIVSKADVPQLARALRVVASGGTFTPPDCAPRPQETASGTLTSGTPVFRTAAEAHRLLTGTATDTPSGTTSGSPNGTHPNGTHPNGTYPDSPSPDIPRLGPKESETLRLLSRGLSYDQIAARWGVAASTVRTHAHRAVDKLHANSLAHAIALFLAR